MFWRRFGPTVSRYHARYYDHLQASTWQDTHWLGIPLYKLTTDLWVYQELLHELRPGLIIETGTFRGGSALYLASIMDLLGHGEVATIELKPRPDLPVHPRIHYLEGSSTAPESVARMRELAAGVSGPIMVILDSYHGRDHVLAELETYHELVTPGSYLVVEDTAMNGHPTKRGWGEGPWEALDAFLPNHPEFVSDRDREKFLHTFNPRGYLRRTR
jgi:cephalosporin hydroxylase